MSFDIVKLNQYQTVTNMSDYPVCLAGNTKILSAQIRKLSMRLSETKNRKQKCIYRLADSKKEWKMFCTELPKKIICFWHFYLLVLYNAAESTEYIQCFIGAIWYIYIHKQLYLHIRVYSNFICMFGEQNILFPMLATFHCLLLLLLSRFSRVRLCATP